MNLEAAIIAASFSRPNVLPELELEPGDFSCPDHRLAWLAMATLYSEGLPTSDPVLLTQKLEEMGMEGPAVYLSNLPFSSDLDSENLAIYAKQLRDTASTRLLRKELANLSGMNGDFEEILNGSYKALDRISNRANDASRGTHAVAYTIEEEFEAIRAEMSGHSPKLKTGLSGLDEKIGGWEPGNIVLVAGRPGMGKSSLLRTFAWSAASSGVGALVISLEDTSGKYKRRILSDVSGVPLSKIHNPKRLSKEDLSKLDRAVRDVAKVDGLLIDDRNWLNSNHIARIVRRHKQDRDIKLVTVDYVQLMREAGVDKSDAQGNVDEAIRGLAVVARQENVVMLVASQLSRKCEERDDKKPQLSDLRWSGELEQVADTVIFPFNASYYLDRKIPLKNPETELIIAKQKSGPVGSVPVYWDGETATYRESF